MFENLILTQPSIYLHRCATPYDCSRLTTTPNPSSSTVFQRNVFSGIQPLLFNNFERIIERPKTGFRDDEARGIIFVLPIMPN
ncbi:hypothetical protein RRG08_023803 [Elysia crispata]|uniref:Uncharacterized protein n=1 Tax=Elysia crispata TaxID=231223 RepID=A0AAE0ZWV6_9GAST|nr:hypothetical protein RRG08_023803 [Elysia crispata]